MKDNLGWVIIGIIVALAIGLSIFGMTKNGSAKKKAQAIAAQAQDITKKRGSIVTKAQLQALKAYREALDEQQALLVEKIKDELIFNIKDKDDPQKYNRNFGEQSLNGDKYLANDNPSYDNFFNDLILRPIHKFNELARKNYALFFKVNDLPDTAMFMAIPDATSPNGGWIPQGKGDTSVAMKNPDHRRNIYILIHLYRLLREARVDINDIKMYELNTKDDLSEKEGTIKFEKLEMKNGSARRSRKKEVIGYAKMSSNTITVPRHTSAVPLVKFFGAYPDAGGFEGFELPLVCDRDVDQFYTEPKNLIPEDSSFTPAPTSSMDETLAPNIANLFRKDNPPAPSYQGQRLLYNTFLSDAGVKGDDTQLKKFADEYMYQTTGMMFRIVADPEVINTILDKLEGSNAEFKEVFRRRVAKKVDWIDDKGNLAEVKPRYIPPLPFYGEIVSLDIVRASNMGFLNNKWKTSLEKLTSGTGLETVDFPQRVHMPGPVYLQVEMRFYWFNFNPDRDILSEYTQWSAAKE